MKISFIFLYIVIATIFNQNYIYAENSSYAKHKMQNGIQPESSPSTPHHTPIKNKYKFCNTTSTFDTHFHISYTAPTFGPYWTGVCTPQSSNFLKPQIAAQHNFGAGYWLFGFTTHETITLDAMGECGLYWSSGFARGCARYYSDPKAKCSNRAQVNDSDPPPPNSLTDYDWCNNSYICVFSDPIDPWGDVDPFNMPLPHNTPSPKVANLKDQQELLSIPYIKDIALPAIGGDLVANDIIGMILSKLSFLTKFFHLDTINKLVLSNVGCIPTPLAPFPPDYTTFAPIQTPSPQAVPICQLYYDGKIKMQQISNKGTPCGTGYAKYTSPTPTEQNNGDVFFSTYSLPAMRLYYDLPLFVTNDTKQKSSTLTICSEGNNTNCINSTQKNRCGNVSSESFSKNYFAEYTPMNPGKKDFSFTNLYPNAYATKIDNNTVETYNLLRVEQNKLNVLSNAETFDIRATVSANSNILTDGISFTMTPPLNLTTKTYTFKYEESENNQFCILSSDVPPTYIGCIKRSPMPMPIIVGVSSKDINIFPDANNTYGIQFKDKEMKIIGPQDSADSPSSTNFTDSDFKIDSNNICSDIKNSNNQNLGLYLAQGDDVNTMQSSCIYFQISKPYQVPYLNTTLDAQNKALPSAITSIQGNKFSLYPTDAYNTPASLFGNLQSSNSNHQYIIGEYVDNKGNKVNPDEAITYIKTNIDHYINNTSPSNNSSGKQYYYIGGLEYRDYTYIRGATKLCLNGYSNNDFVVSPNLSHAQDVTHSNQAILNNFKPNPSNTLISNNGAVSNINSCNSNNTTNVRRDSQYSCMIKDGLLIKSCEFTYNGNYKSMHGASLYLPDRVLPVFSKNNNQYIDSTASMNHDLPIITPYSQKNQFHNRKKTPQELGVCVDVPQPQCIVTNSNNNTPGIENWNSGKYSLGEKIQGTEILKNSSGIATLEGMCVGDPQNIWQTKIIKISSNIEPPKAPECPGGYQATGFGYDVEWPAGNFPLGSVQLGCTDEGRSQVQGTCKLDNSNQKKALFQDLIQVSNQCNL